ncbi:Glycosyltransferase involved in cell wall bisynthesis [Mitsuaria sp. PDC51]|uniref:glycosyltransferase n=1 Tax=Mitsuaria sp. PDC51 TaxID=1881035 RepID=UPI0008ED2DF4|nr:glycosyltransferase [Mitsuaria sp. PDC51]SFR81346.1 Glycosyltransferase involved in cell wall bisynthesis [Mitsuaria sp. PDC51]
MRALSIVHVVFSSRIAGGEHHCVDLANAQAALGHTVHVIGPAGSAVRHALDQRVRFHGLRLPVLRGARVRRLAARLGADIVHGHLGPACKAVAAARDRVRVGTLHVGYKAHHHAGMDALVCVNSAQVGHLKDFGGMHRVIYNWAPERSPASCAAKAPSGSLRQELGIPAAAPVIGCVGRLHAAKGMHTLIEAFQRHAPPQAHLVLIGEGPQRAELESLRGDDRRIHLLGFRWNVDELLGEMDLYVSSSREEQFPLAILEAMRARLPIVATATLGAREMLDPAQSAIVPVDDAVAMGQAIAAALAERARNARRPVDYDMDRYDRSSAVRATLGLYQEALARQGVKIHDLAGLSVEDARG